MTFKDSNNISIDKTINKNELDKYEIKKIKYQPFRYISIKEDQDKTYLDDPTIHFTIMKKFFSESIMLDNGYIMNLNNKIKIDNIIENHKEANKKY